MGCVGLKQNKRMKTSTYFNVLPVGSWFRLAGYDDLFFKRNETQAKDFGCGLLTKPIRLARKGAVLTVQANTVVELL
jgi:hypothetical protein